MCGIAGIHVKEAFTGKFPVDRMADALLLGIEPRGTHATGYVSVNDDGQLRFQKAPVPASDFIAKKKTVPSDARTVLLHTRFATKGEPSNPGNNHPVQYNTCFAVHNGHISNDDEIFQELDIPRQAEVDSEAIAALFSYHGIASNEDIKTTLETLRGGFAIAAIDPTQKLGRLILAKGQSSPLYVLNHRKALIWASSEKAIKDAWGMVLGTPPKKKIKDWGENKDYEGLGGVWQGKCWVLDGDELEVLDFKSSYFRGNSSYSSTGSDEQNEWDDWYYPYHRGISCESDNSTSRGSEDEETRVGWERQPGWDKDPTDGWVYNGDSDGQDRPSRGYLLGDNYRQWTCTPNYKNCEHPCVGGCNSFADCTCIEGHPDHPRPGTALVRYRGGEKVQINRMTGEVLEGSATELYQCDGCDAWLPRENIGTLILGSDSFDLCPLCWEAEGEGPFPVASSVDSSTDELGERRLRNQIWQRALAETAWELNCSTDYVVWILLECPDDELRKDGQLKEYYEQTAHEFANAKAIAHDLLTGVYEGG